MPAARRPASMRSGRPWWTYAVPYFGRVPDLAPAQWRTLGLLGAAELFDHYDLGILGLALLQIQQGLGIGEGEIAGVTAVVRLGVIPVLIEPGRPDQNGRHERFHETLKEETASPPRSSIRAQQDAFDVFQQSYNEERPHEALGMKPPAEVYELSRRSMPSELAEHSYAKDFEAR